MLFEKIVEDERGSINVLKGGFKTIPEFTILVTKKGYARGGCIHSKSEEVLEVFEGEIKYFYEEKGVVEEVTLKAGDKWEIPENIPHYFISLTDSIVFEWGPTEEEKKCKYEPFRKKVLEWNNKLKELGISK